MIEKEIREEYASSIQVKTIETRYFSRIYDGCSNNNNYTCYHKTMTGILITFFMIGTLGIPLLCTKPREIPITTFHVYFTKN
jgi:hypothetical protein